MKKSWKAKRVKPEIKAEIQSIATIGLVSKSTYLLEKLIWLVLGIVGLAWLSYVIYLVILDDNPTVTNIEAMDLTDIDVPAITICSESMNRIGIVERISNSIESTKLKELTAKWTGLMKLCATLYNQDKSNEMGSGSRFKENCFSGGNMPKSCQVRKIKKYTILFKSKVNTFIDFTKYLFLSTLLPVYANCVWPESLTINASVEYIEVIEGKIR